MKTKATFLPQGCITGLGSLPLTSPQAAVAFVEQMCPEIPFWPQLPRRTTQEQMIEQALGSKQAFFVRQPSGPGYRVKPGLLQACLDEFSIGAASLDAQTASGFFAFEQAATAGIFRQARAFKGQQIGPITLACCLFDKDQAFLFTENCLQAVSQRLVRLALWQMERLQQCGRPVICFLDEPCLALLSHEPYQRVASLAIQALRTVIAALQAAGVLVGLHCCANLDSFQIMCQVAPDIISFDAYENLERFGKDPSALRFLAQGGLAAFGLVPTVSDWASIDVTDIFTRWLLTYQESSDIRQLVSQTMITATCGLGLLEPAQVAPLFQLTQQLSTRMQKILQ
jgi:hypothetical protein